MIPEVSIRQTTVEHLDKILGENDRIIFRCLSCETYLLPRELHTLTRQGRGDDGNAYSEVIFQCPVCNPFPDRDKPVPSDFMRMTRESYERRRMYERANLIMPEDVKLIH